MTESEKKELNVGEPLPYDLILARGRIRFRRGAPVTEEILRIIECGNIVQIKIEAPLKDQSESLISQQTESKTLTGYRLKRAYVMKLAKSAISTIKTDTVDPLIPFTENINSIWTDQVMSLDIDALISAVSDWVDSLNQNPNVIASTGWFQSSSNFLPEHMLNVAKNVSAIGFELGFSSDSLKDITLAAFVHDIGELFIDRELLMSKVPLEPGQIKRLREHPRQSVEWLKRAGLNSESVQRLVLRHHERFDGSGYPYNITGKVLGEDDCLIALTDVYTAMISSRPHRQAFSRRGALRFILDNKNKHFPLNLVQRFAKLLGLYPPGSVVQLKGGGIALVINSPTEGRWSALLLDTESTQKQPELIDLNHLAGDYIIREYT